MLYCLTMHCPHIGGDAVNKGIVYMKSPLSSRQIAGFTMVEMMAVVVLVGLAATMAVPGLQKAFERMKYRAAVRDVTSTLRVARSTAISTKQQIGVMLDDGTRTITVFADRVNPEDFAFESGDSVMSVDTLPPQIVWLGSDCTNDVIAFEPNGSCGFEGGGNFYSLAYTQDMTAFHTSNVLAATGRVATSYSFY